MCTIYIYTYNSLFTFLMYVYTIYYILYNYNIYEHTVLSSQARLYIITKQ